jgi:PhzF family phenazine biosynthesis protein
MRFPIYEVNAFSNSVFGGNPAGVCPLNEWLPEELMQQVAMQNNLAETAFVVPENGDFHIRWFTPTIEVALCGHATLASAFVYFNHLGYSKPVVKFNSKSGWLRVSKQDNGTLMLDFPSDVFEKVIDPPPAIFDGLKIPESNVVKGKFDYLVELDSQKRVEELDPDFRILSTIPSRGVIATSRGEEADFVSRCFFPQSGIDEDPVTGSAHCLLTTYWSSKTGKNDFNAIQLSKRKGYVHCVLSGDRVLLSGNAVLYLKGEIEI